MTPRVTSNDHHETTLPFSKRSNSVDHRDPPPSLRDQDDPTSTEERDHTQ